MSAVRAPDEELALVLSTLPGTEAAEELAERLVEERLIACASLLPGVVSVYRWNGAVHKEPEVMVLMKTPRSAVGRLFERIAELHPYQVPELVSLSADAAAAAYCRWVFQETIEVSE